VSDDPALDDLDQQIARSSAAHRPFFLPILRAIEQLVAAVGAGKASARSIAARVAASPRPRSVRGTMLRPDEVAFEGSSGMMVGRSLVPVSASITSCR
jgi:hypothetical protein